MLIFFCISVLLARWAVKPVDTAWNHQQKFVADASHELKTPITSITGFSEILLMNEDKYDDVTKKYLKIIKINENL